MNTFTLVLLGLLAIPVLAQELPVNLEQRVAEAEQLIGGRGGRKEIGKALFAIGNLQSSEAADALDGLMSELSAIDRGSAILALGMCHNDAAKNHLRKIVADSKHLPDRNTAARVLASEGDGLWLLKRFEKEKNAVVAASMLYAIVDSGLADINDEILKAAGSDRSAILKVTIWLKTMDDFDAMNRVYDEWVPKEHLPVRACVEAKLADPSLLVEIQAEACLCQ